VIRIGHQNYFCISGIFFKNICKYGSIDIEKNKRVFSPRDAAAYRNVPASDKIYDIIFFAVFRFEIFV